MPVTTAVLAASWLSLAAESLPDSVSDRTRQAGDTAITIVIESWWGGKAEYKFGTDGAIRFVRDRKRPESHVTGQGRVSAEEMERFIQAMDKEGFFRISSESIERQIREAGGRTERTTDQRTYSIAIRRGKHENRISYYDVHGDARRFPKGTHLQMLRSCVRCTEQFLSDTVQYPPVRDSAYE